MPIRRNGILPQPGFMLHSKGNVLSIYYFLQKLYPLYSFYCLKDSTLLGKKPLVGLKTGMALRVIGIFNSLSTA
jgi:hypothetical protein